MQEEAVASAMSSFANCLPAHSQEQAPKHGSRGAIPYRPMQKSRQRMQQDANLLRSGRRRRFRFGGRLAAVAAFLRRRSANIDSMSSWLNACTTRASAAYHNRATHAH